MPLFVLMLMLAVPMSARVPNMTEAQQIERHRDEVRVLKEKHGSDVEKRFREHMSAL